MKKLLLLLMMTIVPLFVLGQADSYLNKNKAYITAQDFIKNVLTYPSSAEFDNNVIHETNGVGKCTVIGKVEAKNAFGTKSEYTYKIWLSHNGKDWTETSNWSYTKIILENPITKKQEVFYGSERKQKPTNNTTKKSLSSISGISCTIVESGSSFTRITTSKKMTEAQIKKAVNTWNISTPLVYFHLVGKTDRGTEYAMRNKDLILIY